MLLFGNTANEHQFYLAKTIVSTTLNVSGAKQSPLIRSFSIRQFSGLFPRFLGQTFLEPPKVQDYHSPLVAQQNNISLCRNNKALQFPWFPYLLLVPLPLLLFQHLLGELF